VLDVDALRDAGVLNDMAHHRSASRRYRFHLSHGDESKPRRSCAAFRNAYIDCARRAHGAEDGEQAEPFPVQIRLEGSRKIGAGASSVMGVSARQAAHRFIEYRQWPSVISMKDCRGRLKLDDRR
jgi:hypothetical protein